MKVSIIIVNYNTDSLTIQAIESVINYVKSLRFEIIIVDNCSPKGTKLDVLTIKYTNVFFYKLNKNLGFGKANNFGFKKSKGEFIFLLNSDAYLIEDCLSPLVDFLINNKKAAAVTPDLLTENGEKNFVYGNFLKKEKVLSDLGIITRNKSNTKYSTSLKSFFKEITEVDYISGASMLIKREILDMYGMFNPKYFMYYEDMDLCYKFNKFGYKNFVYPFVKMIHIGGASWGSEVGGSFKSSKIVNYSKYLFLKNTTNKYEAFFLYTLLNLKDLKRIVVSKIKKSAVKFLRNKKIV